MSWGNYVLDLPFKAENDFSEEFVVVELGSSSDEVDLPASTSAQPLGVTQNAADEGESVSVRVSGVTQVVANGAYSKGDLLGIAATTGRVDTATALDSTWDGSDTYAVGIALEAAGAAGEIHPMLIRPVYYGT